MRVGVVILPQYPWAEAKARWKSLEDRGFAHGWTYDHLSWRDLAEEMWFGTIPTLTAVAAVTSRLRLGTWVTSPNFRHPVTFAKDLMTIDDISGGRLIAAIGAGGTGWDATVLGQPPLTPGQRTKRLAEFVTLTDLLLTRADTSWQGEYFQAEHAKMIPANARARIPLIVAANGPRTMKIAAGADGWATTGPDSADAGTDQWWGSLAALVARFEETAAAAGRDPATIDRYLDLDSAPVLSGSSIDAFTDAAGRAAALGFTDVLTHWPRPSGVYAGDDAVLGRIADLLTAGEIRDGELT
jgi:alkanesulfonate monooxygenase SsuD/methylene tetrahydromethanopterin reductase-like flavin-dependent oxidoreductase (luciferase family)